METMRANVFRGVNDFRIEEIERPRAGVGEAVIRVTLTTRFAERIYTSCAASIRLNQVSSSVTNRSA